MNPRTSLPHVASSTFQVDGLPRAAFAGVVSPVVSPPHGVVAVVSPPAVAIVLG